MAENGEKIWGKFLKNHWKMFALIVFICVIAFIGMVTVFLWFVGEAQITSLVPKVLNQWSMGFLITFILHLIFWELILIGIPVLIVCVAVWQLWWKKIPDAEREEYRRKKLLFGSHSKRTDGGGIMTFLINIGFVIKIYLDGNWGKPFAQWEFDYLVYSYLWVLIIFAIIIGIPIAIGGIWWLHNKLKKES
jgi:hypothetical protein